MVPIDIFFLIINGNSHNFIFEQPEEILIIHLHISICILSYLVYMNTVDPDDLYPAGGCFASPRGRDREDPHQCCLWLSWVPHRGGQTSDGGNPKLSHSGPGETIYSNFILLYCIMHSMYYQINIGLKIAIQGFLFMYVPVDLWDFYC